MILWLFTDMKSKLYTNLQIYWFSLDIDPKVKFLYLFLNNALIKPFQL